MDKKVKDTEIVHKVFFGDGRITACGINSTNKIHLKTTLIDKSLSVTCKKCIKKMLTRI